MRVRHLQSHLSDQDLVYQGRLDALRQRRVGVDAVFWLRSIQALKDPFADALGGIPPGIFGFVDKELELFRRCKIVPFFVFQGIAPGPQHSMFVSRMDQQMEAAWTHLANGQKSEAQKCFAVSTSRINGDFVYFIFHHLKYKGYECLQAPYFAGAQLAHFAEAGVVQAVFGPPGMLLYGVQSVIIHIDFQKQTYDWVDLVSVLEKWGISRDQFVDACMLAGTEYCLTYPFLNLGQLQPQIPGRFNFDAAVSIVKQAPLINWMQMFSTEEMKNDHVDGYCTCKVLVQNSPVLCLTDSSIRPLGVAHDLAHQVPSDFSQIMGQKLPNVLCYLMIHGIISHKLPQALAKGEWTDKSQPLVDTVEFRTLLQDLTDYRQAALGLIARHLNSSFQSKRILFKAFWDPQTVRQGTPGLNDKLPQSARFCQPAIPGSNGVTSLKWKISADQVKQEQQRQACDQIDFKFCLQWHANEVEIDGPLLPGADHMGPTPTDPNNPQVIAATVHMMTLEHLGLVAEDGSMTMIGNVLKETPRNFFESTLIAFELMKFGVLNSEPFEAVEDRAFPEKVRYPRQPVSPNHKAVFLLSRVMSLVPMKLRNDMWNADVDFDLAAFHSLVRILKRTLRQLVEASLVSVLLRDLSRVKLSEALPSGFMCASPKREDHLQTPAVLPTFMLPRACMGIVVQFFLQYKGDPGRFQRELELRFPCCMQPVEDLQNAFRFWNDFRRCVDAIAEDAGIEDLSKEMQYATEQILEPQQKRLGIAP